MIRWFGVLSALLWLTLPCNEAMLFGDGSWPPVSRYGGNVIWNILGTENYRDHIVASPLDVSSFWKSIYWMIKYLLNSISDETGIRTRGTFLQRRLPPTAPFPCQTYGQRSASVPDSVHELRPGDIDVIAAMGDSITVGTAANAVSFFEILRENRGIPFSIGGYGNFRTHLTIPNILKEFNPRLIGYSLKDAFIIERASQFNLAEVIATTSDMPYMAYKLQKRMRMDPRVNMKKHWKLVTIMIGANDFCSDICYQKNAPLWMNREQEKNIIQTLRILRDTMPRTFVNLVAEPAFNMITSLDRLKNLPGLCDFGRKFECTCMEGPAYSQHRNLYFALERNYKRIFERVTHLDEFHTKDFTVVFQPFGLNATVFLDDGRADISIMAADCIHWSQKGHAVAANALWNNMMQPPLQKQYGFRPLFREFECPSETNPFLRTYWNSQLPQSAPVRIW